jgi:AraC-like DNA-binding protein
MNAGYAIGPGWKGILAELGVRHEQVLSRAGLPGDLLSRNDTRVPAEQFFAFAQALEELVGGARLPLHLVEIMSAEFFSPAVFASLCSPNLAVAAERLARFKPLVGPIQLDVDRGDAGLQLTYRWRPSPIPVPASLSGAEALFVVKLARMGTHERVCPTRITLPTLPPEHTAYEEYLGASISVEDTISVVFSPEDAERPFLSADGSMWDMFEPQLRQRLADLEGTATLEDRVRAVLLEALPSGQASLDFVARRLAMSGRSLQRRLRAEGTNFKAVVQRTRENLARYYLSRTDHSSSQIAYLLGFGDPTSFFRAFQGWTGTTPDAIRQATMH